MGKRSSTKQRILIAQKAAEIIVNEGVEDFHLAKRKACDRLGLSSKTDMPRNLDVEAAIIEHQRLFSGNSQSRELRELRQAALDVMLMLDAYEPRLVGSVLKGTANALSVVHIHVFSDDAKSIAITFLNAGLDFQAIDRRLNKDNPKGVPGFQLDWKGVVIEVLVFAYDSLRNPPPSPVDGKPIKRAGIAAVESLLDNAESAPQPFMDMTS